MTSRYDDMRNASKNLTNKFTGGICLPLKRIRPDPDQPRKDPGSAEDDLNLLADSIVQHGILQPVTVQPIKNSPGQYQLIFGERRFRAAQLAYKTGKKCHNNKDYKMDRIPVIIRNPESESDKLEMQLVENLARTNMSDTDISRALNPLIVKLNISKAEMARHLGRSDTWIKNILARVDPGAEIVSQRIGVPMESIGSNEVARLVSWSKDSDKQVILDQIAKKLRDGAKLSRALLDTLEKRYELTSRHPQLKNRKDLTLDDLRTWEKLWDSKDAAQVAVANRVLNGMTLTEAMQLPKTPDVITVSADQTTHKHATSTSTAKSSAKSGVNCAKRERVNFNSDFKISDSEVRNIQLGRKALEAASSAFSPRSSQKNHAQKNQHDDIIILRLSARDDRVIKLMELSGLHPDVLNDRAIFQAIDILIEHQLQNA